ncbi:transcriptional repressor LexA, partial [Clostridium sp.]|uniref:transcriptional repressor LexA n=1 Tax=Clostridium sp. TaxID=1506 RepID=UPI0034641B92
VYIKTLKDILKEVYIKDKNLIDETSKKKLIYPLIEELKSKYKKVKIFNRPLEFFIEEIEFLKSSNITKEEYMTTLRRKRALRKNSTGREAIFYLKEMYNEKLKEYRYYDYEDYIKEAEAILKSSYTHVMVYNGQDYSCSELELLKNIRNHESTYGTFTIFITREKKIKVKETFGEGVKTHYLKGDIVENRNSKVEDMEKFKYIDLRHKSEVIFKRDYLNTMELFLTTGEDIEEVPKDDLREVTLYSDIAAGEPILMTEENEGIFNIPNYFLKGIKDCFMLKVKGDSMVGANIEDNDYVVIRKQYMANNGDIVAAQIDGNATLKRFVMKKNRPYLVPENPRYEPINLMDKEAGILGIVVGVVKSLNS